MDENFKNRLENIDVDKLNKVLDSLERENERVQQVREENKRISEKSDRIYKPLGYIVGIIVAIVVYGFLWNITK